MRFIFLCNSRKSLVNICLMKKLKCTVTKLILCFYNLFNAVAFAIFPTPITALFRIHQRFKGLFFNQLNASFNVELMQNYVFPIKLKYWVGVQQGQLTSWGERRWLLSLGHPSSDGVTIKIPYMVDVLHQPAFRSGLIKTESG